MDLYFSSLACSMATRIAFYEAGLTGRFIAVDTQSKRLADGSDFFAVNAMGQVPVLRTEAGLTGRFIAVDTQSKRLADGSDFFAVNAMGQVPVLRTDAGELLTENPAVLQYVADQSPQSGLAPQGGIERYRLQQWLNFITSELHKVVFIPLLDPCSPEAGKLYAHEKAERRFGYLNGHLDGRDYLLDHFTVADAYLVTVLNWARFVALDLAKWPAIKAYLDRMLKRPNVAKALAEEMEMFEQERVRRRQ
jgi:glutathione S-transferase